VTYQNKDLNPLVNPAVGGLGGRHLWGKWEVELLTDVVGSEDPAVALAVHRLHGEIYPVRFEQGRGPVVGRPWPIPGRPDRAARGRDGGVFVLTAEGAIWQTNTTGQVVGGWDAAGAPNGPRAELVDVAADPDSGRVYALDQAQDRVLVFEAGERESTAPLPKLPPPCTVATDKDAQQSEVPVGEGITITLSIRGACGRKSSVNDILLLMSPARSHWSEEAFERTAEDFVEMVDFSKDRVAVMVSDSSAREVVGFTQDRGAVRGAIGRVFGQPVSRHDRHQLDLAREYMLAKARPEAARIIVWVGPGFLQPKHNIIKAEHVRRSGIRTIVISDSIAWGYLEANMAYQLEDYFVAPDRETLHEVYVQLGQQFRARVLARDLTVTDEVPTNMEYVPGSAVPPADWDAATRTLAWRASDVSFAGWQASYQVIPQQDGHWPTNVWAQVDFIDGIGHAGQASFPIPWIRVLPLPPTPTPDPRPEQVYLPAVLARYAGAGEE
jgi:hypothetical protein